MNRLAHSPGARAHPDDPAQKGSSMNQSQSRRRRIQFDFELVFADGGRVRGDGFRLSLCGDDISDAELAARVMRHLRLPGARRARILSRQITGGTDERDTDLVDRGHRIEGGLITSLTWPRWSSAPDA
jgi:hypothetical protein